MRWTAAQTLGWIINRVPYETKEWTEGMGTRLPLPEEDFAKPIVEPIIGNIGTQVSEAEKDLAKAIAEGRLTAWGRPTQNAEGRPIQHALVQTVPASQFKVQGLTVVVDVYGQMAARPSTKQYEGPRWEQIEFDPSQVQKVWRPTSSRPPVPQSIVNWMHAESENNLGAKGLQKRADIVKACMVVNKCTKLMAEAAYAALPVSLRLRKGRPKSG